MGGRRVYRRLASLEEAIAIIRENVPEPKVEEVSLDGVLGRALAEDVYSEVDVPPFDRSTKDGFAVRAADTYGADEDRPISLRVIGRASAGHPYLGEVGEGEAVEIATGAPIPRGADAVVMVERTHRLGDELMVYRSVTPGENVQSAGGDVRVGETVLTAGSLLGPAEVGILAASGRRRVRVFAKPRVAVGSTGDELREPWEELEYGQIRDVNRYVISAAVRRDGGVPIDLGIVPDDEEEIEGAVRRGLEVADLVIFSGSTSAGAGDVMYRVVDRLGPPGILIHGVAIQPGKPTVVGAARGKLIFGLPGNPTSSLTAYRLLASLAVRRMAGLGESPPGGEVEATAAERIEGDVGRRGFLPVHLVRDSDGGFLAFPVPTGSEAISTLARADGFVEKREGISFLGEGSRITVRLFSPGIRVADLSVVGSHCIGLERLIYILRSETGMKVKFVAVGTTGGFSAVRRGEADLAGVHALDPETGEYNVPYIGRYGLKDKAILVRGYKRRQGLMVPPGNPKGVGGIGDLLRGDLTMINRNPGSGTRMLLDRLLEMEGVDSERAASAIRGYTTGAKSHGAVAAAVRAGLADVGVGIEAAAAAYGLDFIPLAEEWYDLLVRRDRLGKEGVRAAIRILRSGKFAEALESLPGMEVGPETGRVIYPPGLDLTLE